MKPNVRLKYGDKLSLFVLFILTFSLSSAQVTFTEAPENLQLYPRDANNKANVKISGKLLRESYTGAILEVYEDNKLISTKKTDFASTDSARFTFDAEITARPSEYTFKVLLTGHTTKNVLERSGVVCGDFIVLYGQSNMKALVGVSEVEKATDTRLLRNYDIPNQNVPEVMRWYRAHEPHASVGVIGLHLQALILKRYGIPTCVINGSVGGASLVSLINPDEPVTRSYYGLLYSRIKKAGALGNVKAIIWRQGEAETCNWYPDIRDYPENFEKLYGQLSRDFMTNTRFYNIQTGILYCNQMEEAGELREYMRQTKYLFPGIETTNMHGLPLSDDVHYSKEGFIQAAEELLPLLGRDIYGDGDSAEVHPPDVQKVLITASRDTIILVFEEDQKMIYPSALTARGIDWEMEDYIYVNTNTAYNDRIVQRGWADRNRVYLTLRWSIDKGYVSYLPSYTSSGPPFQGIHLLNGHGLRAMSFYQVPVTDALKKPEISAGDLNGQQVTLTFRENDQYVLERRFDRDTTFSRLSSVRGDSYEDLLEDPFPGAVEYRIKRVSATSESEYSAVFRITMPPLSDPPELNEILYPNPFGADDPFLKTDKTVQKITAISRAGKEIPLSFRAAGREQYTVHTQKLSSGRYILQIKTTEGETTVRAVKL